MNEQFDLSNDNYSPIIIGKNNAKVIVSTSSDFFLTKIMVYIQT